MSYPRDTKQNTDKSGDDGKRSPQLDPLQSAEDAPPPYVPPTFSAAHQLSEDPLDVLRRYNTVVVLDDSGSMQGALWTQAINALRGLAQWAAQYDRDGIDVYLLNNCLGGKGSHAAFNLTSADAVVRALEGVIPSGGTPLGARLKEILDAHAKQWAPRRRFLGLGRRAAPRPRPLNILVITDGIPTDDPKAAIVAAARTLDALGAPHDALGLSFVQIGDDARAAEYLRELDDDLPAAGVRDMVDTTPYAAGLDSDPEALVKILLGGVHRRVDRKGGRVLVQRQR